MAAALFLCLRPCPSPHGPWPFSLVELTEEILKLLMELVFRLVCSGELSLARVLRKNILDKAEQRRLLRCADSDQPLAARGVAARCAARRRPGLLRALPLPRAVPAAVAPFRFLQCPPPRPRPHRLTSRSCPGPVARCLRDSPGVPPGLGLFSRVTLYD